MTLNRYEKVDMFAIQTQRTDTRIINLIKTAIKFNLINVNNEDDFKSAYDNFEDIKIIDKDNIDEYDGVDNFTTYSDFVNRQYLKLKKKLKEDDTLFLVCEYPVIHSNRRIAWGLIGSDSFTFQNR